jgi:hypothetical protein
MRSFVPDDYFNRLLAGVRLLPLGLCWPRHCKGMVTMTEVVTTTHDARPKRRNGAPKRDKVRMVADDVAPNSLATHLGCTRQDIARLTIAGTVLTHLSGMSARCSRDMVVRRSFDAVVMQIRRDQRGVQQDKPTNPTSRRWMSRTDRPR